MNTFKTLILALLLFAGYESYADTRRDTFSIHFDKGSSILNDTEKARFRDVIAFKDSITSIYILARPDGNSGKCRSRRLAKKRGKSIKSYLLSQGIASDKVKVDYDIEASAADISYHIAFISFGYNVLFKVQSDN